MKHNGKTALTLQEKITCAWAHEVQGVDQHVLAAMYGVNPGRVNEAIMAIRKACGDEPTSA